MAKYETICKLKDNGKLYIWSIELVDGQTMKVSHGQYGGKIVTHENKLFQKQNVII